jgi:serine/threonine protein kinase
VRKQIQTLQPQAFLERSNIEYVQRFEDDHIVKLVKAYAHGENINLVFPKAWTNLDHLLRDNEYHYDSKRGSSLSAADAWIQLQGISSALKRMHGFGSEESGHSERMTGSKICIHFDLKPDNILVEEGLNGAAGRWLITDFGQAALAPRGNGTTPLVGGHFGTDAYAPPEIDESVDTGRAYDIWSLGCIMLEIAAFVLYSYAGLKGAQGLDQARRSTQPGSRGTDERFFYRERGKQAVVKKAIYDFMVQLQTDHAESGESDPASKEFLSSILCIIQDMLRPQAKDRINMERVVDSLVSALAQAKADPTGHDEQPLQESQNETILGGAQLRKITLWRWLGPGKGNRLSNLEVSEDNSGVMRLHCWAKGLSPVSPSFHRADIKIIPLYAFWDPDGPVKSRTWLNFLRHSEPYSVSVVADTKYAFDKLQDARHVQSTVTSQEILDSFDLTNFKFQTPQSLRKVLKGFKGIWSKQKAIENVESTTVDGDSLDLGSATIQIWVETPPILDKPVVSVSRKNTLYQSDSELSKVPPRRVCIYLHKQKFVFTIKVDDNWVVGTSSHDTGNSRSGEATQMFFEPHPKRNPSFYGSWLRPTPAEHSDEERYPAGIPLDPKVLQYYEDMDSVEIESVELTFANSDGCKTFHEKYLDTKERWSKERSEQHDRIQVNREPETRPRLPEGVNRLPFPAKKVPFRKTNVDRDSQSSSRLSTAGSMHDSTMEHVAPQQETRFLTVGHSHNHRRRRASNEHDA